MKNSFDRATLVIYWNYKFSFPVTNLLVQSQNYPRLYSVPYGKIITLLQSTYNISKFPNDSNITGAYRILRKYRYHSKNRSKIVDLMIHHHIGIISIWKYSIKMTLNYTLTIIHCIIFTTMIFKRSYTTIA